jgi:hypothetical protein
LHIATKFPGLAVVFIHICDNLENRTRDTARSPRADQIRICQPLCDVTLGKMVGEHVGNLVIRLIEGQLPFSTYCSEPHGKQVECGIDTKNASGSVAHGIIMSG